MIGSRFISRRGPRPAEHLLAPLASEGLEFSVVFHGGDWNSGGTGEDKTRVQRVEDHERSSLPARMETKETAK